MGANNKRIIIKIKLNNNISGIIDRTIFLLLFLPSLTNLDIATGSPKEQSVINKLNVCNIKEYIPIPSVLIALVSAILIIIPNILAINPPNINIIVDFIKLFFIFNYMKNLWF